MRLCETVFSSHFPFMKNGSFAKTGSGHTQGNLRKPLVSCADGVPIAAAALQFPIAHPCIATVIPGMRSPQEVEENVENMNREIPIDVWRLFKEADLLDKRAPTPLEHEHARI